MTPRSPQSSSVVAVVRRLSFARRRARGITYVEVLVVIGLILVALAFLLPTLTRHGRHGEGHSRVKCASNLRQIGQAILLYSNDNKGAYPRTRHAPGAPVVWATGADTAEPFGPAGPAPNDVSAAIFLLLRTQDITSEVFVCPVSNAEKWDSGGDGRTAANWSNFVNVKQHLSYSYQNVYPDDAAEARMKAQNIKFNNSISAEFAVAADINPGLRGGGTPNVFTVTTTSSVKDMKSANSANHDFDGQNILYGDGHVNFEQNPFVGVQRDNIYTVKSDANAFSGTTYLASPFDGNDSILLPTAD